MNCHKCKSKKVIPIVYGLPSLKMIEEKKA